MVIIYATNSGGMAIVNPTDDALKTLTLQQIGVNSVPSNTPFWIVQTEDLPADRAYRDAWEIDAELMGTPAGYGATTND